MMIWRYMYISWMITTIRLISTSITSQWPFFSFLMVRTSKITLWTTSKYIIQFCNYSQHAVHYIPRIYSSFNWKFVPFDHYHPIPPNPALDKQQSTFCSVSLVENTFFKKTSHWLSIFSKHISEERFACEIFKELVKLRNRKTDSPN